MLLNVQKHGFQGALMETGKRSFCLICVSGSEGGMIGAKMIARAFYKKGIPSLAVAYFKTEQTPSALCEISLETITHAVDFLLRRGYAQFGIYGFSKGSELALLSAARIPSLSIIIAASPASCVFEGLTPNKLPAGKTSWTWRGVPSPYVPMNGLTKERILAKKRNHEFGFSKEYNTWLDTGFSSQTAIPVEQIRGPVLLLSARNDEIWPSERMGEMIVHRLEQHSFPYPYHHAVYDPASHLLCPIHLPAWFVFPAERAHPAACAKARKSAFDLSVSWIRRFMPE